MQSTTYEDFTPEPLKGTVKWYSPEKGFGFIDGRDGVRRFFHISDTVGDFQPKTGSFILFEHQPDRKGPRAVAVRLNPDSLIEVRHVQKNGRTACPHCAQWVVPRLSFQDGTPQRSFCPLCGGEVRDFVNRRYLPFFGKLLGFALYVFIAMQATYSLVIAFNNTNLLWLGLGVFFGGPTVAKLIYCIVRPVRAPIPRRFGR